MEFRFFMAFILTALPLTMTHAATPPELYWQSMLPSTPMPKALRDLLPSEEGSDSSGSSLRDNAFSINLGGFGMDIGHDGSVSMHFGNGDDSPFSFGYGGSDVQHSSNSSKALFFLDKDLHPGTKMSLRFPKSGLKAKFLERKASERIPFSSDKLSEILHQFSVQPNSTKAKMMKKIIEECEKQELEGENKCCATSLEAMVDFSISKLGRNVQVMATEINEDSSRHNQEFSIAEGVKMVGDQIVVCHALKYVYPVYYCHKIRNTKSYMVPLVGSDGRIDAKTIAVCHTETSKWNPNHLAFQVLKVKPGTVPICHFLPEDHITWFAS